MPGRPLSDIARQVGGTLVGKADPWITGAAGLTDAGPGDVTFVADRKYLALLPACRAAGVIIGPGMTVALPAVRVDNPYEAFVALLEEARPDLDRIFPPERHPTAVVAADADVAAAAAIGPYCVIGPGAAIGPGTRLGAQVVVGADVRIGRDCLVYPQVVLREGSILGDRVVVHAGAVIGSDGFGYLPGPAGLRKIPQVGIVQIEDDVEIGAGTCIDRATTGRTVIGAGTKIDNQVQIAHNVTVGRNCALSAQTGISGSAVVGDGVVAGGQVGIGDHLKVGARARLGGRAGVWRDLPDGAEVFGYPALDVRETFRITGALRKLPELLRRVARLEHQIPRRDTASGGEDSE